MNALTFLFVLSSGVAGTPSTCDSVKQAFPGLGDCCDGSSTSITPSATSRSSVSFKPPSLRPRLRHRRRLRPHRQSAPTVDPTHPDDRFPNDAIRVDASALDRAWTSDVQHVRVPDFRGPAAAFRIPAWGPDLYDYVWNTETLRFVAGYNPNNYIILYQDGTGVGYDGVIYDIPCWGAACGAPSVCAVDDATFTDINGDGCADYDLAQDTTPCESLTLGARTSCQSTSRTSSAVLTSASTTPPRSYAPTHWSFTPGPLAGTGDALMYCSDDFVGPSMIHRTTFGSNPASPHSTRWVSGVGSRARPQSRISR